MSKAKATDQLPQAARARGILGLQRFVGKVVIVTGAGSGIGETTARRFSQEGACVALADRVQARIERVAADLPIERTLVHKCDVAKPGEINGLVRATIRKFGQLDVLVNNAGVVATGDVTKATLRDWETVMAINVGGVFHGCRAAMPHLIRSKGCIVNTASLSGLGADWGMCVYDTSKGAVVNLTRSLALDFGRHGVRVNSVCPTVTLTAMSAGFEKNRKMMAALRERVPLGRPALPADIAAAITFLASADAGFITGVNLPVDGGVSASNGEPKFH
jgi:meso-butanediol dehydrogenase / (S,S)-butanediol dehydrogenase / diacetyl reductase